MSDLVINSAKFNPKAIGNESQQFLALLRSGKVSLDEPWWEIGMKEYRRREEAGELKYKPPRLDHRAQELLIPSRDQGRTIPCRVFVPESPESIVKGVFLFIHGGGWSVFNNSINDAFLAHIADTNHLAVLSVEYRLAPEFPFPRGPEDCHSAAEWLVENSERHFGAPLSFMAGGSSGGHFAALTALHLRESRPSFHLRGLIINYGIFDLTYSSPSIVNAPKNSIITSITAFKHTTEAFVPNTTYLQRRDPKISPFYADLQALAPLPPALFICGTEDILIDDSVFFSAKWMMVSLETVLKVFPGAVHGFMDFEGMPFQQEGWDEITAFVFNHE